MGKLWLSWSTYSCLTPSATGAALFSSFRFGHRYVWRGAATAPALMDVANGVAERQAQTLRIASGTRLGCQDAAVQQSYWRTANCYRNRLQVCGGTATASQIMMERHAVTNCSGVRITRGLTPTTAFQTRTHGVREEVLIWAHLSPVAVP